MNYSITEISHETQKIGFHQGKRVIAVRTGFTPECSNAVSEPLMSIHKKITNYYPCGIVIQPQKWHCGRCDPAYQGNWDKFVNFSEYAVHFHTNGEKDITFMCDWLGLHLAKGVKPTPENVKFACEIFVYADNEHELDEFEEVILEYNNGAHIWLMPRTCYGDTFCRRRVLELESPINYRLGLGYNEDILQLQGCGGCGQPEDQSEESKHAST